MCRHIPDPGRAPRVIRRHPLRAAALLAVVVAACDGGPPMGPDGASEAPTGAPGIRTTRGPGGVVVRSAEGAAAVKMHRASLREAVARAATPGQRQAGEEAIARFEIAVDEDDPTITPEGGADFKITLAQTGVLAASPSAKGTVNFEVNVATFTNEPGFMHHTTNVSTSIGGGFPRVESASFWPATAFASDFTVFGVDCRSANRVSARSSHEARKVLTALHDYAASAGRAECRGRCSTLIIGPGSDCDSDTEGGGSGGSCHYETVIIEVNDGNGWREIWRGQLVVCD